jgi:ribosomal protein S19
MTINNAQEQVKKYVRPSTVFSQWPALCGILPNIFIGQRHFSVTEEHT